MLKKVNIFIDKKFRDTAPADIVGNAIVRINELCNEIVRASAGMNVRETRYSSEVLDSFCDGGYLSGRFVNACKAASRLEIVLSKSNESVGPYPVHVTLFLPNATYSVHFKCRISNVGSIYLNGPANDYAHPY